MPDDAAYFVQFPHPGAEHDARELGRYPWNTSDAHRRKFLVSPGRAVTTTGDVVEGDLAFWGEWEPPSYVEQQWPWDGDLPRYLHRPVWERPEVPAPRQNTDPWVFGDHFLFSNCRQLGPRPHRRPSAMQQLTRGSVVLFGSKLNERFVLDTVFVVASAERYDVTDCAELDVSDAFRTCTFESLVISGSTEGPLTLFRGATVDRPVHGMYSFVPCRPAAGSVPRFPRPAIELPGYVNAANARSAFGAKRPLQLELVKRLWEDVKSQLLEAGCWLGASFSEPVQDRCQGEQVGSEWR